MCSLQMISTWTAFREWLTLCTFSEVRLRYVLIRKRRHLMSTILDMILLNSRQLPCSINVLFDIRNLNCTQVFVKHPKQTHKVVMNSVSQDISKNWGLNLRRCWPSLGKNSNKFYLWRKLREFLKRSKNCQKKKIFETPSRRNKKKS